MHNIKERNHSYLPKRLNAAAYALGIAANTVMLTELDPGANVVEKIGQGVGVILLSQLAVHALYSHYQENNVGHEAGVLVEFQDGHPVINGEIVAPSQPIQLPSVDLRSEQN